MPASSHHYLLESVIKGDRSFFEGLLADEAIITDRNGKVVTKAEALKNCQPLPDLRFSLARVEVRVLVHGDAAVLTGCTSGHGACAICRSNG